MILTRQQQANTAAERWRRQYGERRDTYTALVALGPTPDPDAVDRAIGNTSWTELVCDRCEQNVERVDVVDATGGDGGTVYSCEACLRAALEAFQ